jgi:hypothetical protein
MKSFLFTLGVLLTGCCLTCLTACSSSDSQAPAGAAATTAQAAGEDLPTKTPDETIQLYLEAVRTGDAVTVNKLLTVLARQKTTELNIAVAPPGSPTARFQVGEVRYLSEAKDAAHVQTQWTDETSEGETQTLYVTWILRNETAGWRVAGMMGQFIEGQPAMVFNFEDPEEVIRQQDYAREEMARRRATARQAQADTPNVQR